MINQWMEWGTLFSDMAHMGLEMEMKIWDPTKGHFDGKMIENHENIGKHFPQFLQILNPYELCWS